MSADLRLEHLLFAHPASSTYAVQDFSLRVPAGQMVALLGSSGSGKSTVLRLAAGLERPQAGDVLIEGRSQLAVAPERRGITMMFQKPLLFPHLSVIDNVAFAGRIAGRSRREARAGAARYLDLVHLGDVADRRSRQLSGGQEQRVSLARALAAEPAVLLLDEPFGALDTAVRASMYDLLEEIRAMLDPTIVLVTHDLAEAALADRVAVLEGGAVVQEGTVPELHSEPADLHVARLLGGFAEVSGQMHEGIHHSAAGVVTLPPQCRLTDGPATLLIHRHSVTVHRWATGSAPRDDDAAGFGAATSGTTGSMASSVDTADPVRGMITRVRSTGLRRSVTITLGPDPRHTSGGPQLEAEVGEGPDPGSREWSVGQEVGLQLHSPGVWAVPEHRRSSDQRSVTYSAP